MKSFDLAMNRGFRSKSRRHESTINKRPHTAQTDHDQIVNEHGFLSVLRKYGLNTDRMPYNLECPARVSNGIEFYLKENGSMLETFETGDSLSKK